MKRGHSTDEIVSLAKEGSDNSPRAPWWFLVPVPARQLSGATVDSRRQVGFTWSRIPKQSAEYHIKIVADRRFKKTICSMKRGCDFELMIWLFRLRKPGIVLHGV